jgi:NAD+ synthase (glutamine-hydrolysing)
MKYGFIKVASATPKIKVADTEFNGENIRRAMKVASAGGAKILCLPECCLTGYTCGDLFEQKALIDSARAELYSIIRDTKDYDMLTFIGIPMEVNGRLYNCAAAINGGRLIGLIPKTNIPNYGEFYEKRWFTPAPKGWTYANLPDGNIVPFGTDILFMHKKTSLIVACELCEDVWVPNPPSIRHAMAGANVIVNLSASDELVTKEEYRRELISGQSARLVCGYIYADAGEGESTTDLVFAGHNLICENGTVLAESDSASGIIFSEIDIERLDYERKKMGTFTGDREEYIPVMWGEKLEETKLTRAVSCYPFVPQDETRRRERCERILSIQAMGLKKRLEHTGAENMVVGISGGLDSTLAMLVAVRAAGKLALPRDSITAVTMPCFGTTERTKSNAIILAERLGATVRTVDIGESVKQHFKDIGHDFNDHNVVFENGQARERTQVLMDIANENGGLVVGTGDLSELALGWATYNGDHMSMYGVNAGVPKTLVRHLVRYCADETRDEELRKVLLDILDTPVSPELLPAENGKISQKTEDLVGPYELHDFYLYYFVRWGFSPDKIRHLAHYAFKNDYDNDYDNETIDKWLKTFVRRFFSQQFKRSCLPDGPKVGSVSLSPRGDWRMPSDAVSKIWLKTLEDE